MKNLLFVLVAFILIGCDPKNEEEVNIILSESSIILKVGEKSTISSNVEVSWATECVFVASVERGEICGQHVGETKIIATNGLQQAIISVKVENSVSTNYREPYLDWGKDTYTVARYLAGEDGWLISTLNDNEMNAIDVFISGLSNYQYFVSKDSGIDCVDVRIPEGKIINLSKTLEERYHKYKTEGSRGYYMNSFDISTSTVFVESYLISMSGNVYQQVKYRNALLP